MVILSRNLEAPLSCDNLSFVTVALVESSLVILEEATQIELVQCVLMTSVRVWEHSVDLRMGHLVRSMTLGCYNEIGVGHLAKMALLTFYTTESPFSTLQLIIVLLEILHAYYLLFPDYPVLIVASVYESWQQNLSLWCCDDDFAISSSQFDFIYVP